MKLLHLLFPNTIWSYDYSYVGNKRYQYLTENKKVKSIKSFWFFGTVHYFKFKDYEKNG